MRLWEYIYLIIKLFTDGKHFGYGFVIALLAIGAMFAITTAVVVGASNAPAMTGEVIKAIAP